MFRLIFMIFALSLGVQAQFSLNNKKSNNIELEAFERSFADSIFIDKSTVKPGESFSVIIDVQLKDGWYVYWKTSGGIGAPMDFQFTPPEGIKLKEIHFPYPKYKYDELISAATFYNQGHVTYVADFEVSADAAKGEKVIDLVVNWQACKVQCIQPFGNPPVHKIKINIGDETAENAEIAKVKKKALEKIPVPAPEGWTLHTFLTQKEYKGQFDDAAKLQSAVVATIVAPENIKGSTIKFFPTLQQAGYQSLNYPVNFLNSKTFNTAYELDTSESTPKEFSGVIVITKGGKTESYKISAPISKEAFKAPATDNEAASESELPYRTLEGAVAQKANDGFLFNILLAFVGGFILNLMPCVFPVLSIKVMGFVNHAKEGKHKAIQHALVFTLGALLSFWILAGTMLALKSATAGAINWGFQLQSPIVVFILVVVLFLMSLNLFGVFEIGVGLTSAGQSVQGKSGFAGSFFSGILATVVATPCMAPMLGAALSYALTQPAFTAMIVFTFICLGMCSPYIVLAAFPKFLKFIPKPGAWMETFKQSMGFLMMLAVVWLMETLQKQMVYPDYFFNILWGFVLITVGAWIYGKYTPMYLEKSTRIKGLIAAILIAGLGVWYSYDKLTDKPEITWAKFNQQEIDQKLAEGTPVFIDFTATWCLTCQLNKKNAIYPNAELLIKKGVYTVKADFTNKDPKMAEILQKFGSSGVPLNLLYDGKDPRPVKFPEIYNESTLTEQLNKLP